MELTANAMSLLDENLDFRQLASMRAVLAGRLGLLPGAPFNCNGTFVRNSFEVSNLRCMALLPSGWMLDVNESVSITIPMLYDSTYYFAVGLGENLTDFEHQDVEYLRPEYSYQILSAEELKINQSLPLLRFNVKAGTFNIDPSYIPPCLMTMSSDKFQPYRVSIKEKLDALFSHKNLPDDGPRLAIGYYQSHFSDSDMLLEVRELVMALADMQRSLEYYIFKPHQTSEGDNKLMECDMNDIQLYLEWTLKRLDAAKTILDNNPIEDKKPDYDELKAILRKELMDDLKPTLEGLIHSEVEAVRNDIQQQVSEALKDFLSGEFRRQLYADLNQDLADSLYQKLYDALYQALYGALYHEEKVETDEYTPMI